MSEHFVENARLFATAAHAAVGQVRKYTGEPYINHPAEVVGILAASGVANPHILAAAWLHDVVEDTQVTLELIRAEFGACVATLVEGLTDVSTPQDGNRAERKRLDREHTARQSSACKTIKLADLISNTASIVTRDPQFARVYLQEKAMLLTVLQEGHPVLLKRAEEALVSGLAGAAP